MAPVGLTVGHVPFSNQSWWPEEKELRPETCVQFLLYCKTWSECRGQMVPPDKIWGCGQKKRERAQSRSLLQRVRDKD